MMLRKPLLSPQAQEILRLAWPLIIANGFWNLQLTIDRVLLGQYSTAALGAAIAVTNFFWVPMALLQQTVQYMTAFVSQCLGASRENELGDFFWHGLTVALLGGLLFLGLIPLSHQFFLWAGHAPELQMLETQYFTSLAFAALPMSALAGVSGYLTGVNKTTTILVINFVGLVFNAVLDWVLIFGHWGAPALGIQGAGFATAISSTMAFGFGLVVTRKVVSNQHIPRWSDFRLSTHRPLGTP